MNKNRNFLKSLLVALVGTGAMISVSQAVTLKINYGDLGIKDVAAVLNTGNVSPIHFADNGNDFGGFLYFTSVDAGGSSYKWEEENSDRMCPCKNENGDSLLDDDGNPIQFCKNKTTQVTYSCDDNHEILDEPAPYQVKVGNNNIYYNCRSQVKGFYYNSQRGERLWPLDKETAEKRNLTGLTFNGGIYTRCSRAGYEDDLQNCIDIGQCNTEAEIRKLQEKYYDTWSYYGMIEHEYQGQEWNLVMGVNYKYKNPWIGLMDESELKLSPTFQRFDDKYPVGFIYDYNGGLGLVGCRVTDEGRRNNKALKDLVRETKDGGNPIEGLFTVNYDLSRNEMIKYTGLNCGDIGSTANSLLRLVVDGLVGMSTNTDAPNIVANITSDKMQTFGSVNVNNAELINFTKQKAESLCRGKWTNSTSACSETVCCFEFSPNSNISVRADSYEGRTLIVKNGNVIVEPITSESDTSYYDIFIDKGNLLIEETSDRFVIGRNGFIISNDVGSFNSKVADHFLANPGDTIYTGDGIAVASVLNGNFIVNGNVQSNDSANKELKNKYFIYGKFTTKQSYDELYDIFKRKCNGTTDNTDNKDRCPMYANESPYQEAFLAVVDQNYNSPLYW